MVNLDSWLGRNIGFIPAIYDNSDFKATRKNIENTDSAKQTPNITVLWTEDLSYIQKTRYKKYGDIAKSVSNQNLMQTVRISFLSM